MKLQAQLVLNKVNMCIMSPINLTHTFIRMLIPTRPGITVSIWFVVELKCIKKHTFHIIIYIDTECILKLRIEI